MVEVVVAREMMRHLLVGLLAVEHVGWRALSFWALEEVEARVQMVAEVVVRLESAREC